MDISPSFIADAEMAKLVQPSDGSLRHPAQTAQTSRQ